MRSRLSYCSIALLVGLVVVSGLIFVINPFNGTPANASPGSNVAAPAAGTIGGNASSPSSGATTAQTGNGPGSGF